MKHKKILAVLGLAAVVAAGGALAYYSSDTKAANEFDTAGYSSTVIETFNPKDGEGWEPGKPVDKDVTVKNTGKSPIVARAKFSEEWTKKEGGSIISKIEHDEEGEITEDGKTTTYNKITTVRQGDGSEAAKSDGLTAGDWTVVEKLGINPKWVIGEDGWYYYIDVLGTQEGERESEKFLDSVRLSEDVDMGKSKTSYLMSYEKKASGEKLDNVDLANSDYSDYIKGKNTPSEKVDLLGLSAALGLQPEDDLQINCVNTTQEGAAGYSDADYTLTITVEMVQATKAAAQQEFGNQIPEKVLTSWNLRDESLT